MEKILKRIITLVGACLGLGVAVCRVEKMHGRVGWVEGHTPYGFYEKNVKRSLDFGLSLAALVFLFPVMAATGMIVRIKLGKPVIFRQERPGLGGGIFTVRKFRTMRDGEGSDEDRLTDFGKKLRSTSLDELPELFNILKGEMSFVGPRPQLVRDMFFMSDGQKMRHSVKPGLSGLAQVNGRNGIGWEEKLDWDLKYIEKVSFIGDVKIVFRTFLKAVVRREGITDGDTATALDYGDWLLKTGKISREEYEEKQREAEIYKEKWNRRFLWTA